jgi:hypothetical protein
MLQLMVNTVLCGCCCVSWTGSSAKATAELACWHALSVSVMHWLMQACCCCFHSFAGVSDTWQYLVPVSGLRCSARDGPE